MKSFYRTKVLGTKSEGAKKMGVAGVTLEHATVIPKGEEVLF